jgi:hypothetical protein
VKIRVIGGFLTLALLFLAATFCGCSCIFFILGSWMVFGHEFHESTRIRTRPIGEDSCDWWLPYFGSSLFSCNILWLQLHLFHSGFVDGVWPRISRIDTNAGASDWWPLIHDSLVFQFLRISKVHQ